MNAMTKCPCCEHESNYYEWYSISNDYRLLCPKCDNVVQYDELPNGALNEEENN